MAFKDIISSYGKQIAVNATIGSILYTSEDIISANPHYDGALYTSVMKCLDIELDKKANLAGQPITSFQFGARAKDTDEYTFIDFGSYIVKECEWDEDTETTTLECYDSMILSMVPYSLNLDYTGGVTVIGLLQAICQQLGFTLATTDFTNATKVIECEKYDNTYNYRDVLTEIAQVAGGMLTFKADGLLYMVYPTQSGETITEDNLKDLKMGQKYGPVNSLVLARAPQEDNVYIQDTDSIALNDLCEVRIENNQIMDSHRDDFLADLFNRIKGTTYYLYDLNSYGIGYLNLGDQFTIQTIDGTNYPTMVLRDDLQITQGVAEELVLEFPDSGETDYSCASETDKAIKQTIIRVNKQEQQINALVSDGENQKAQIQMNADNIEAVVSAQEQNNAQMNERVSNIEQTADAVNIRVDNIESHGVDKVTTSTGFTFDDEGLTISKTGSEMETNVDEDGLSVFRNDEEVLTADNTGVKAINTTVKQYLTIGLHARFEDYADETDGNRTACFYVEPRTQTTYADLATRTYGQLSAYTYLQLETL